MTEPYEFLARCASGFESCLAKELRKLGISRIRPLQGGVVFFSNLEGALRACLWSRCASRILMVLERIDARDADTLYAGVRAMDWTQHLAPGASFAVSAQGMNDQLRNTKFTALRVKDAVCDQLREARGVRPDVETHRPDVFLHVSLRQEKASIMLDLSGEALHRRGYREEGKQGAAPLKETLGASMLLASGWDELAETKAALVDPMCGSGTLAIEAAMMAADMAPGIQRDYWGFLGWAGHDREIWECLLDEADERFAAGLERMPEQPRIVGCDIDSRELSLAQANAKRAGLAAHIEFFEQDASLLGSIANQLSPGLIATNPPYGERLSSPELLSEVYDAFSKGIEDLGQPWKLCVITPDETIDRALRSQPFTKIDTYNGSLEAAVRLYLLDASSRITIDVLDVATGQSQAVVVQEKNSEQFASRLLKVAKERRKWARRANVTSYRVYDSDLPDYAVAIDIYRGAGASEGKTYLNVAEYAAPKTVDEDRAARRFDDVLAVVPLVFGVSESQVFSKMRRREKGGGQYRDNNQRAYHATIEENGYFFELDLSSRLDTGIFLDHRTTRKMVGEMAKGTRFLNLFAYTGTASVYAAGSGALSTLTVDLSQTYLSWAKRNMVMNGFSGEQHQFVRADVLEWIEEASKSGEGYDLIFVDPPTFSNSKSMGANTWSVQRDHVVLLSQVARLLAPGGKAVFSCNLKNFKPDVALLREQGIGISDITAQTIPEDFKRNPKIHHCYIVMRNQE